VNEEHRNRSVAFCVVLHQTITEFDSSAACRVEAQLYHFKHLTQWPPNYAKVNCMSPELMMWFVLATRMAVTAPFVTAATVIAE
jgi:hypothetical protein